MTFLYDASFMLFSVLVTPPPPVPTFSFVLQQDYRFRMIFCFCIAFYLLQSCIDMLILGTGAACSGYFAHLHLEYTHGRTSINKTHQLGKYYKITSCGINTPHCKATFNQVFLLYHFIIKIFFFAIDYVYTPDVN